MLTYVERFKVVRSKDEPEYFVALEIPLPDGVEISVEQIKTGGEELLSYVVEMMDLCGKKFYEEMGLLHFQDQNYAYAEQCFILANSPEKAIEMYTTLKM